VVDVIGLSAQRLYLYVKRHQQMLISYGLAVRQPASNTSGKELHKGMLAHGRNRNNVASSL
jgi:hypothetical protein